jgi:hypothetical protein
MPRSLRPNIPAQLINELSTVESCRVWIEKTQRYLLHLQAELVLHKGILDYVLLPRFEEIKRMDERSEKLLSESQLRCESSEWVEELDEVFCSMCLQNILHVKGGSAVINKRGLCPLHEIEGSAFKGGK